MAEDFKETISKPSRTSRSILGCPAIASTLHLDDLPEGSCSQEYTSIRTDLRDSGASSLLSAVDSKQKEQIRLVKEYIFCCQSAISPLSSGGQYSSLLSLSMCDDNEIFERSDSTATIEYGSFLPKLNGPRNRQSAAAVVLPGMTASFSQAGRDTPASSPTEQSSPISAPKLKTTSSKSRGKSRGSGAIGAVARRSSARASQESPAPAQDEEACSVFRSQVAAALGAGRAVWL
jgi:hypothetical protein